MTGGYDDHIVEVLDRILAILEAQETRRLVKIKSDDVLHEQNRTRAARLLVDLRDKKDPPLEPGWVELAKRLLPGDDLIRRVGDEITYDGGATWRKDPSKKERR